MTDFEPWLDTDAPPDVAESLRAARAEVPRRAVVERCVALVGAGGAVGLSASTAAAGSYGVAGKAMGVTALAKWGLAGFAAGSVLMAGVELTTRVATPPAATRAAAAPSIATPSIPMSRSLPVERLPEPRASAEPRARRATPVPSNPSVDERLAAELALLSNVRAAIDRRDAETALLLLAEHDHRYRAAAQLLPEARYLRLEALELAGRRDDARAAARRILDLDPRGPHAARAREVLEKE